MPAPRTLPSDPTALQEALLSWYRATRRSLPWREKPSLYATVVSEFMLQQTQVKTVLPYFARWLKELPDFKSLAAASEEQVLHLWEGLGYYSRARNLQKLSIQLAAMPLIPKEAKAWMELPGIGPYTAAAVTSIAFGTPAACVDGNVVRILARWTADATPFKDSGTASKAFAGLAQTLLNTRAPGDHNQAMMELGATVCTRHNPQCLLCPVARFCEAERRGDPENFPKLASKTIEKREVTRLWSLTEDGLLLHQAEAGAKRLATLLELPTPEQAKIPADVVKDFPLLATHTRGITRYRITEQIHQAPEIAPNPATGLRRIPLALLPSITLSGPHRRWIQALLNDKSLQ